MKKIILFLSIPYFILSVIPTFAQSKFHLNLDYHYMLGFREHSSDLNLTRNSYKMHGNSLRLIGLYTLTQQIEIGTGIGADRYEEPGYNTFPVFATIQYSPFKRHIPFYAYTNLGYSLKTNNAIRGTMWDLGIGYKHMLKKHFGLKLDLGYNLKNFREEGYNYVTEKKIIYSSIRQSLSCGIGLIF